ncbi:hypothetical protein IQ250_27545 [Pseudanabaenaceae cyanobacterium LEGE 13415]|nr:hypothetical protein [Pseudanabaenaceae cyanobacterium LEGE 13415]
MYTVEDEILELVEAFKNCMLARSKWTHSAHLTIAVWYLINDPHTATDQIRCGIQRYNQAHGIESTPTSGYHETMTQFWIHRLRNDIDRMNVHDSLLNLTNQLTNCYSDPTLVFQYYSHEVLFSPEARSRWIEPNLKSLNYARL